MATALRRDAAPLAAARRALRNPRGRASSPAAVAAGAPIPVVAVADPSDLGRIVLPSVVCNDNVNSTFSPPAPFGFSISPPPSPPPWVVQRSVSFNLDPGCVYNPVYPTSLIRKSILRPSRYGLQSLNSFPNVSGSLLERHNLILEIFSSMLQSHCGDDRKVSI
jgi:hypothetical protein